MVHAASHGRLFGGFQALCPFHRKRPNVRCTKYSNVSGATEQDKLDTLKRLLQWCNLAEGFLRARHHCEDLPALADVPPDAVLVMQRIHAPPAVPVKTDVELDAEGHADLGLVAAVSGSDAGSVFA